MATQFDPPVYTENEHREEPRWSGRTFRTSQSLVDEFKASFPIFDLKVCPGHKYLEPSVIGTKVLGQEHHEVSVKWDPIIINIRTSVFPNGTHLFREAEIWDGHHRLHAALLKQGKYTPFSRAVEWIAEQANIADTDTDANVKIFDILLNLREAGGVRRHHWLKLSGAILYPTEILKLEEVNIFNANMNSARRTNLKGAPLMLPPIFLDDVQYFPDPSSAPRIGLFFGTFDPVHNGHLRIVDWVLNNTFIDIVVLIPNAEASNKTIRASMSHRCNMLRAGVASLQGLDKQLGRRVFVFLGNSNLGGSVSWRLALMEGMSQVFGTPVDNIWHIEGTEALKSGQSRYRSIFLPRKSDGPRSLSQLKRTLDIHHDSQIVSEFYDQWNLSSSQVRCWLQTYRLLNPSVGNSAVRHLVEASLPIEVIRYIESHNLYLAETPVFHLASKVTHDNKRKQELAIHSHDSASNKARGYLLTTGADERLQEFRRQASLIEFATVESNCYQGNQVDLYRWQSRMLVTINDLFLECASSTLMSTAVPSPRSAFLTADLDYPLSTWEIACYLSHYLLWGRAFRAMHTHTVIFEDRVVLPPEFSQELRAIQSVLEDQGYNLCYLYSKKKNSSQLSAVDDSNLLLTAYMLSKQGLEMLLENAFPIEGPVDWYVKNTLVRLRPETCFATGLVGRNTKLVTTVPKLYHRW